MEESGVRSILEMEAEESEDEWHGLGGVDGELSEEYDSELEKMIDDYSQDIVNPDEIRNLLAKENKELDLQMVNKILHDVKNGGFRKRRGAGMVLEISDEDDEDLENYRSKRRELMKQKRLELTKEGDINLMKNGKVQAFFESMVEDIVDEKNAFQPDEKEEGESSQNEAALTSKQKMTLSEEFVQQSLSFLRYNDDKQTSAIFNDNYPGKENSDLLSLKQHSHIKRLHAPISSVCHQVENHEDELHCMLTSEQTASSVSEKFGSHVGIDNKLKNGKKTVTVSRTYKTVGGNRAAITYMGKMRKLVAPKRQNVSRMPSSFRTRKLNVNTIFDNDDTSFEV